MKFLLAAIAIFAPTIGNAATDCFTIYDAANVAIYRSGTPPIDLSRKISDAMSEKFPGHYMVWSRDDSGCPELLPMLQGTSPMFRTANEMGGGGVIKMESFNDPFSSNRGSSQSAGTDINVRPYTRSNGTAVSGHTRAAAGRGH